MKTKLSLIIAMLFSIMAHAQVQVNSFVLPDGREIPVDKLDSVKKAWNGKVMFRHNDEDDKKHIMHLIRETPEMEKQFEEASRKQHQAMQEMIGKQAIDFSLKDLHGKTVKLSALKGKVVVLNFWFTSCPPCNAEMPELNKLVTDFQNQDVVFLALTFNDISNVQELLKNHPFNYNILPSSTKVDKLYQISSWPTSLVIGRNGNIAFTINYDQQIYAALSAQIKQALNN